MTTTIDRSARPASTPRLSLVVPALGEADNLRTILPKLPADAEVIVVEGRPPDHTRQVVDQARPETKVIVQSRTGKGNAIACGVRVASGDVVVLFDADGSARPEEIGLFVSALRAGADFVKGTRTRPGGGSDDLTRIRRVGNRVLTGLCNVLFGTSYSDLCYGYNAFWRDVAPVLDLPDPDSTDPELRWGEGFEVETMINCRVAAAGLRVAEVPSHELDRLHGVTNLHAWRDGRRVLRTLASERLARRDPAPSHRSRSLSNDAAGAASS